MTSPAISSFRPINSDHLIEEVKSEPVAEKSKLRSVWDRVANVAQQVFKYVAVTAFYCVNPSLFVIGAVFGVMFHEQMSTVASKVSTIWEHQDWAARTFTAAIVMFTLPIFLAAATFIAGAHCGAAVTSEALDRAKDADRKHNEEWWKKQGIATNGPDGGFPV